MEAAYSYGVVRHKRYSGQQEEAPKKKKKNHHNHLSQQQTGKAIKKGTV